MVGIYKITNPKGKIYIGQSWDIKKRKSNYSHANSKYRTKIFNSIRKYGWNAHRFEIVCELPSDITQEVLDRYETVYWQFYLDCRSDMLNIRDPGSKGRMNQTSINKIKKSWTDQRKQAFSNIKTGTSNVSKRPEVSQKKRETMLAKPKGTCPVCNKEGYVHLHFENCRSKESIQSKRANVKCPYCTVEMDPGNAKRYHFEKCKFKNLKT